MGKTDIEVSVIIINYNTCEMTKECIDSIFTNNRNIPFEVIVVDNGSKDESKKVFEVDKRIKYIYSHENLGFGVANNLGVSVAEGKFILFLNSDTIVLNDILSYFLSAYYSESNIGALGCRLFDANRNYTHSYSKYITIKRELKNNLRKYLDKLHIKGTYSETSYSELPFEVEYITGADLFMAKDEFIKIGGFDPHFFMYCEEVDLQERLSKIGLKMKIISGPEIIHLEGASDKSDTNTWTTKRYHNVLVSKNYYIKKRVSKIKYILFTLFNTLLLFPGIIIRKDSFKNKAKIILASLGLSNPIK